MDLYISPNGKDQWSGRLSRPNRAKTDGPLASFPAALQRFRQLKRTGSFDGPLTFHVRGGTYELAEPLVFGPQDSYPLTFQAFPDEKPVLSGGGRITKWTVTRLNGRVAWVADLPEVREGKWAFRQLFVNGRRAPRPRLPRQGLNRMESVPGMPLPSGWGAGGYTQFVSAPGHVRAFRNLTDVEVVCLHFWIEERSPIAAFDEASRLVTMARPSRTALVGSHGRQLADYYLDNVFDALGEPGEWYLDRVKGVLYYLPRPGETPRTTEVIAPRLLQFAALLGKPARNEYVEFIRFRGLTFAHTDWRHPSADGASALGPSGEGAAQSHSRRYSRGPDAAASQAACDVPGAVVMDGARHCAVEDCTIEHIGWYGVEIGDACRGIRVVGNTLRDLGAGGVKINGAAARDPDAALLRTGQHWVTDNEIAAGGRIFHSAVGVLSMNAFEVRIAHNHIHDFFYTGISCGWEWGYQENISRDNLIECNHIHEIGQGLLSDMGGIYTLGVQPGTVLRGNLIHGVRSAHYGGWCIYPDEGSSHLLIEHNVCCDADRQAFHQHYGRENIVRNNIFAFGGDSVATYSRAEPHRGFTFLGNILVTDGRPVFSSPHAPEADCRRYISDMNLIFDVSGRRPVFAFGGGKRLSLSAWRRLGHENHSVVADPGFRNLRRRDFSLRKNSRALKMGIEPIDLSRVGPRPHGHRD